jgi:hypothetical protein
MDLGLVGQQPNIALAIFFVPYIVFEILSNILLEKFTQHVWLLTLGPNTQDQEPILSEACPCEGREPAWSTRGGRFNPEELAANVDSTTTYCSMSS